MGVAAVVVVRRILGGPFASLGQRGGLPPLSFAALP